MPSNDRSASPLPKSAGRRALSSSGFGASSSRYALSAADQVMADNVSAAQDRIYVRWRIQGPWILIERLGDATHMVLGMLMFIGAAPASMAGGVSTSTIAVLLTAVSGTARGHEAFVFGRTLPVETVAKAVAITTVSLLVITGVTLMLTLYYQTGIVDLGFEVLSAYSNTRYSLGLTPHLDNFGRFAIAFTMFWRRLGPLTIVVALAQREHPALIHYPEEPVILG